MKLSAASDGLTGSSGQSTSFRTAIAKRIEIGGARFSNVVFAVIDGTGDLADADFGIIGIPVLLPLGAIRWSPGGPVEIGAPALRSQVEPNLVFDGNRLLLRVRISGRDVLMTLDTGASTTDLNANFASTFPQAVQGAAKGTAGITGVGGTRTFESLTMPRLTVGIGGAEVLLRPATVTLQQLRLMGGDCCVGNAGEDLLEQAGFTIDFAAMTLRLGDQPR